MVCSFWNLLQALLLGCPPFSDDATCLCPICCGANLLSITYTIAGPNQAELLNVEGQGDLFLLAYLCPFLLDTVPVGNSVWSYNGFAI